MILPDANVLLYATNRAAPRHAPALAALEAVLNAEEPVGFAWTALLAFLRLSTRPGIFAKPLSLTDVFDIVDQWLGATPAQVLEPTSSHAAVLRRLLVPLGTGGNLTSDAHLAALSLEHEGTVLTYDHDFGRFPGVKWKSPE
jgi:toxin-antitoxin system PIN domain toxin